MSSAWKSIKDGASSIARTSRDALKGDLSSIADIVTLGGATRLEKQASKLKDAILPDMPDVNIPEQPTVGATPGAVSSQSANVDLSTTEGQRRTSRSAKGSRKLRIPLGGLGR